jgi:DNA-binding MarR family transcriptional regulator
MARRVDPEALERAKRASVAQLLFRTARRFDEHALRRVRARTGIPLRPAHTALFPHIDLAGTRQSDLAERLGVTKQAVHKLVAELLAWGVLEQVADPSDARASLVRFSTRKGQTLLDGLALLRSIEGGLQDHLGAARFARLRALLLDVDAFLDRAEAAERHTPAPPRDPLP